MTLGLAATQLKATKTPKNLPPAHPDAAALASAPGEHGCHGAVGFACWGVWPLEMAAKKKTKEADAPCFASSVLALCKRQLRFYLYPLRSTPNSSVLIPRGYGPTRSAGGRFMGENLSLGNRELGR